MRFPHSFLLSKKPEGLERTITHFKAFDWKKDDFTKTHELQNKLIELGKKE